MGTQLRGAAIERSPRRSRRLVLPLALAGAVLASTAACTTPAGAIDRSTGAGHDRRFHLSGWADEGGDSRAPRVKVTVDGQEIQRADASGEKQQAWSLFGRRGLRQFNLDVDIAPGEHEVCAKAVGAPGEEDRTLFCKTVTVPDRSAAGDGNGAAAGGGQSPAPGVAPTTAAPVAPPTTAPAPPTTAAPDPPVTEAAAPVPAPAPAAVIDWQTEMLTSVNANRAAAGLQPVKLCASLARAAQSYAEAMAATNHFDHTGTDGSTPFQRIQANGYRSAGGGYLAGAENIAQGYPTVAAVMTGWMNSAGHRTNILAPGTTDIGFGRAAGNWWVQDFGAGGTC